MEKIKLVFLTSDGTDTKSLPKKHPLYKKQVKIQTPKLPESEQYIWPDYLYSIDITTIKELATLISWFEDAAMVSFSPAFAGKGLTKEQKEVNKVFSAIIDGWIYLP